MPSDLAFKAMNRVHRVLLGASGGHLGWRFYGMPVVELTTTGRKSGQPRTTMLTSPYQEDSTFVVVASRGGDDTTPAWFLNLQNDPKVMVKRGPRPAEPMIAEIADADERGTDLADHRWKAPQLRRVPAQDGPRDSARQAAPSGGLRLHAKCRSALPQVDSGPVSGDVRSTNSNHGLADHIVLGCLARSNGHVPWAGAKNQVTKAVRSGINREVVCPS